MNLNLTLIGQAIAFAVFVWFCMKYVWPPVMQALQERQKKIADGLDAASRATRDLELAQEKADETLRESKEQAQQILEQANKRANQIVEEARDRKSTARRKSCVPRYRCWPSPVQSASWSPPSTKPSIVSSSTSSLPSSKEAHHG